MIILNAINKTLLLISKGVNKGGYKILNNFTYYTPTKVVFGKRTEEEIGGLIRECGCQKVLVHYGGKSAKASGLLDRVVASVEKAGAQAVLLGGVVPNPHLSLVFVAAGVCHYESRTDDESTGLSDGKRLCRYHDAYHGALLYEWRQYGNYRQYCGRIDANSDE